MTTPTIQDLRASGGELQLDAVPEAVGAARRFVTSTLREWRVSEQTVETAELVVSELATNAVQQTERAAVRASSALEPGPPDKRSVIWVRVRTYGQSVVVEVWDGDPKPPVMQTQSLAAEHGRGLLLVTLLSGQWGYYWPPASGKVVWAEVALAAKNNY